MDPRIDSIIRRIDTVFGDSSVPLETTLEQMEEVGSHVDTCIDALRDDIERRDEEPEEADEDE